MKHAEHIQPSEMFRTGVVETAARTGRLDDAILQRLFRVRETMLASIEHRISPVLAEALARKILYERSTLREIAAAATAAEAERTRHSLRLNGNYFTLTPLEIDLL